MPLLIAYKLKFITMVPVLVSALVLLVGSTGMAGFFFALFAAAVTNKD
jgi:Tfp pilus assembly protein PilV